MKTIQEQFKQALKKGIGGSKLNENQYGIEDIADAILEKLVTDQSLSNVGISLENLNNQQRMVLSDALLNALMDVGEEYNIVLENK